MNRLRHALPLLVWLLLAACGPRQDQAPRQNQPGPSYGPPPRAPQNGGAPGCGVNVAFLPECEQVIDAACCPQQAACAQDPVCAGYMQCREQCKALWLQGVKGDSCITNCAQQNTGRLPNPSLSGIFACTDRLRYPAGARCDAPF